MKPIFCHWCGCEQVNGSCPAHPRRFPNESHSDHRFCELCGELLIRTSRSYRVCLKGHGPLVPTGENTKPDLEEFEKRIQRAGL